jgi:hypothetical protein
MTATSLTLLVAACAGVFSLAAWTGWILIPAWQSYSRWWERVAATVLSLYVLFAMALVGAGIGVAVFFFSDELGLI